MTTEYTSPITGQTYNVFDVSPLVLNLVKLRDSSNEDSIKLQSQISEIADSIRQDTAALENATESKRKQLTGRLAENNKKLEQLAQRYALLTNATPRTIAEILRTFVKELEGKSDLEILRIGKDLDLLYGYVQALANKDGDKYALAIGAVRKDMTAERGD